MLSNNDKDLLNKMFLLSKKIYKIYDALYKLEINNQINTFKYKTNLKYLNTLIEIEDELYQKIPINKIEYYIKYSNRANTFENFTDLTLILNDFYDNYVFKRVYNQLKQIKRSYLITKYQESNEEKIEPNFDLASMENQLINEDYYNSLIFELNKSANETDNDEYKKCFILIKYIINFLNKNIENNNKNGFYVSNKLFLNNKSFADMHNIKDEDYNNLINNYYFQNIYKELKNITKVDLYTKDYAYQKYRLTLYNIIIKAFMNLNHENIYLKKLIRDIINTNSNLIDNNILNYYNNNVSLIRSERLVLNGNSK